MIRLTLYILLHHLVSWGVRPLIATRTVTANAAALHRFLCEPANQLRLVSHPPRDVAVQVASRASGRVLAVEVSRGQRTVLWVTWILSAGCGTTEVDLAVQFETRGLATRLALALGGRRWLARRADEALSRLALACARAAEDVVPPKVSTDCDGRVRMPRTVSRTTRAGVRHRRESETP
jgi:hypothetical protein